MDDLHKLSPDEVSTYHFTTLGELLVLCVNIIEANKQSIKLDKDLFEKAISFMQLRHPLMRASLQFESSQIFYKIHDKLPLNIEEDIDVECFKSRADLVTRLEAFNCKLFNYKIANSKLWRAFAYEFISDNQSKKYAVGFLMPLFITDGINITTITVELVNIINSLLSQTECFEMKEKLELIPNLDEIVEEHKLLTDSKMEYIKLLNKEPLVDFKLSSKFKWFNETGFKLNLFEIDSDLTERLINANKLNSSKLTAFLTTIAFYALNDLYTENNIRIPKDLMFGLATNLRFRVEPNINFSHIRSLTTYLNTKIPYPDFGRFENVWQDTKLLDDLIANATDLNSGAIFKNSHNFEDAQKINDLFSSTSDTNYLMNCMHSISDSDMFISNTGTYVFNRKKQMPSEPFKIVETYFTDSMCNTRTCLLASLCYHVSYWDGKLMFALCSNKAGIGNAFTERLVHFYKENLYKSVE